MTHNSEIARAVRRALFMGACVTGGITSAVAQDQAAENSDVVDTVVVTGSRIVSPNLQSISPVTSATLREIGFEPFAEAEVYTMEGVVEAIAST